MEYLNPKKRKNKVHIWNSRWQDSYCSMWSTGGLDKDKYERNFEPKSGNVCQNCLSVYDKKHKDT